MLEELRECTAGGRDPAEQYQQKELERAVRQFVAKLPAQERRVFVCRYWYLDSTADIAKRFGYSDTKVRSMLHRTRQKLETYLKQEGVA